MKKILFIAALSFMFSSCNKCKECKPAAAEEDYYPDGYLIEVCSDNFESKDDFNNYIEAREDIGADCKSDFWN